MILKKNGFSYFIWGVSTVLLAVLVTLFWYFSGFVPDESGMLLAAVLAILTIIAACLITFACGRLVEFLRPRLQPDPMVPEIVGDVTAGVLFLAAFIVRIIYLSRNGDAISDTEGLFEQAMVSAGESSAPSDLLSILTTGLLRVFLRLGGNRILVASVVLAAVQVFTVVAVYFGVRMITGRVAAIVTAGLCSFLPVYFMELAEISTRTVFFFLFAVQFLLVAIYLHYDAKHVYDSAFYVIWYLVLGAVMGFMAYVDLGTVILWIMLLMVFMLPSIRPVSELVRLVAVFAMSLVVFFLMMIQEAGFGGLGDTLRSYFGSYFAVDRTITIFHLPAETYPVYLIVVTAIAVTLTTFWRDPARDRTTHWLLLLFAAMVVTPLLGYTRMNAQNLFCFVYAAVIGAGISSLVASTKRKRVSAEPSVVIPEGMVLPMDSEVDDGESRMNLQAWDEQQTMPIGLDRDQEGGTSMAGEGRMERPELSKEAQKALKKAEKAKAKAEAKAQKEAARAAKKAERDRLRFLVDDDDDDDEEVTAPVIENRDRPPVPIQGPQLNVPPAANAGAAVAAAAAAAAATAAGAAALSTPVQRPASATDGLSAGEIKQLLQGMDPQNDSTPVTSRPNVIRKSNSGSDDDFDFDLKEGDDFDI